MARLVAKNRCQKMHVVIKHAQNILINLGLIVNTTTKTNMIIQRDINNGNKYNKVSYLLHPNSNNETYK